jgi:AcrR family transcriptional regulator
VAHGGAAEVSIGDVAAAANVSKALVHYHFRDKDSLLHALVEAVGLAVLERDKVALTRDEAAHALDAYWAWLEQELFTGDLRILLSLAEYDSARVRAASRRIADQRREVAAEHVTQIFSRLGLNPRVPAAIIAETVVAFIDGLAASTALTADRNPRPAFDVLWLALLTLAE